MQEPKIAFSSWTQWANRNSLEGIGYPGVYLLVHFEAAPSGLANPKTKEIIYIGETSYQSLRKRWNKFHKSAFEDKNNHSGGKTYRRVFSDQGENLYVAAFPVNGLDEKIRKFFIRYVERKLIWDYARKWGAAPICNIK